MSFQTFVLLGGVNSTLSRSILCVCNKFGDGRTEVGVAMWIVQFSRFYLTADLLGTHHSAWTDRQYNTGSWVMSL